MIAAVIPTRYRPPELDALLAVLRADDVQAVVLDSEEYGHRIYAMWNAGVRLAGASEIAVLNDDITILPGTLPLMAEALRSDPSVGIVYPDVNAPWVLPGQVALERTEGTWGAGGMTGFCFMFRPGMPRFDERYHWWYGDDAFEDATRLMGYGVARVKGLPIRHIANGSASRRWDELQPLIEQDRARWDAHLAWRANLTAHYAMADARRAE